MSEIEAWRNNGPALREYADAIGAGHNALFVTTILDHLAELSPTLNLLTTGERAAFKAGQIVELRRYTGAETVAAKFRSAQQALEAGQTTEFGRWLRTQPATYAAPVLSLLADTYRSKPKTR